MQSYKQFNMSNESDFLLLDQLPVEILFEIFKHLDAVTLLCSVGRTCHRLHAVVKNYDQYVFNLKHLTKSDLEFCLRVVSLNLSHDEETIEAIDIFCSRYSSTKFTRLQSLTLRNIQSNHFDSLYQKMMSIGICQAYLKCSYDFLKILN